MADPPPINSIAPAKIAPTEPSRTLLQKMVFALSVLCLIAVTIVAGFAFFIAPYGICYLKVYDCPEGILVRAGILVIYVASLTAGLRIYRLVQRLFAPE